MTDLNPSSLTFLNSSITLALLATEGPGFLPKYLLCSISLAKLMEFGTQNLHLKEQPLEAMSTVYGLPRNFGLK